MIDTQINPIVGIKMHMNVFFCSDVLAFKDKICCIMNSSFKLLSYPHCLIL